MARPDNIVPWPVDYAERQQFVRPIPAEQIARALGECTEDYDEQECVEDMLVISRRRRLVTAFCLAAATWALVYFAAQLIRGWLS